MTTLFPRAWLSVGLALLVLSGAGCGCTPPPTVPPDAGTPAPDAGTPQPDAGTPPEESPSWEDSRMTTRWVVPGFGELFSLATVDLDGDGDDELIYGGRGLAAVDPEGPRILWSTKWELDSSPDNSWATAIEVIPTVTGDATPDLLVSNADNQLHLVDGATGAFVWVRSVPSQLYTTHVALVDADEDNVPDLFPAFGKRAWSGATGEPLWEAALPRPATFAVSATLDEDGRGDLLVIAQPDVIVGGGSTAEPQPQLFGLRADGSVLFSFTPEAGMGFGLAAADLDGNGVDEAVMVTELGEVWAVDAAGQLVWRASALTGELDNVTAIDVDGDGTDELFLGGFSFTDRHVGVHLESDGTHVWTRLFEDPVRGFLKTGQTLLVATGEEDLARARGALTALTLDAEASVLWTVPTHRAVRKLALVRRGEHTEVVIGQSDAFLRSVDVSTGSGGFTWSTGGYFWDMTSGDLDGDGVDEVLRGDENGYVTAWDQAGNNLWWARPDVGNPGMVTGLAVGDLDGDGSPEVVVSGDRAFQLEGGVVEAFSADGRPLWSRRFPDTMSNVQVADLDGDGLAEVVVGERGWDACAVQALDAEGHTLWRTALSACSEPILGIGDVEGDGTLEVGYGERVMFSDPHVALLSSEGDVLWHETVPDETTWVELREGGFLHGGFATNYEGHVTRRSIQEGAVVFRTLLPSAPDPESGDIPFAGSTRFATVLTDVTGDGEEELAVSANTSTVYLVDSADGAILWERQLEVKRQQLARANQAGPIVFVPATKTAPAFLAVAQSAHMRTRATLFALDLEGEVVGQRELDGEGQAAVLVRSGERAAAVVGAGLGLYAVEAVPAE